MNRYYIMAAIICAIFIPVFVIAQMDALHGDEANLAKGLHSGNQFRTTFYNDGTFGSKEEGDIAGEWPVNSGGLYLMDGNVFAGSEVVDANGQIQHIMSEVTSCDIGYSSGDKDPVSGNWWTFLPLPGFHNTDYGQIAMSHLPESWPDTWPDRMDDSVDPGWPDTWNGLSGKGITQADQESYFVADDYHNREFMFYPDSTNTARRGLGLRMYVRGFQYSNPCFENVLFILHDFENIGTYSHNKMVLGYKIGNDLGNSMNDPWSSDTGDDSGAYDLEEEMAYMWDENNMGVGGWGPVGYFAAAFLESPGNPKDGIDNDNDGAKFPGPVISEDLFAPITLMAGDPIVLIDDQTFDRTVTVMPTDTLRVYFQDRIYKFWPGQEIQEISYNCIDDNLNGLIDENNGYTIGSSPTINYFYTGMKYIDYFTGEGMDNLFIDESRNDGIDNDADWSVLTDDVGCDGCPDTYDPGENDGLPTSGEPNFDRLDMDESDMLGLTSVNFYNWPNIPLYQDELVWENLIPGFFNMINNANTELFIGSGYFSMKPHEHQQLHLALICAENFDELLTTKGFLTSIDNQYGLNEETHVHTFGLMNNYPNPFNSSTKIEFTLQQNTQLQINIFNVTGQKIRTLTEGFKEAATHQIVWDGLNDFGSPVSGGVYFCRIKAGEDQNGFTATKKMVLLK